MFYHAIYLFVCKSSLVCECMCCFFLLCLIIAVVSYRLSHAIYIVVNLVISQFLNFCSVEYLFGGPMADI